MVIAQTLDEKQEDVKEDTRYVGCSAPIKLYWEFKSSAAARGETLGEALINAIRLYIDIIKNPPKGENDESGTVL